MNSTLTCIDGIKVGHLTNERAGTGCTVILTPESTVAGVDIRGGGPGARELQLLDPLRSVPYVNALLLTGGSAFGLAAADGVMTWLEEHGIGHPTPFAPVPIVPAAVLFDLAVGDGSVRPRPEDGYTACEGATSEPVPAGSVGAGTGCTVGKWRGLRHAMKGGVGNAAIRTSDGHLVAALAVTNAIGDVYDFTSGRIVAGSRSAAGDGFEAENEDVYEFRLKKPDSIENTTLAVVATDASFDKSELSALAAMAHDGLARSIRPVSTRHDGDLTFALSTGRSAGDLNTIGSIAADLVSKAVVDAVTCATTLHGIPGLAGSSYR